MQIRVPAIFPGSFNPLHDGHRRMKEIAEELLGVPVCYELSTVNVDKPNLDFHETQKRLQQFGPTPCWVTCASRFVEKARLFPGTTFVVGADTILRIASRKYYQDEKAMYNAVDEIKMLRCRFLVFGRLIEDEFHEVPASVEKSHVKDLCTFVPESRFRLDLSSTNLRES